MLVKSTNDHIFCLFLLLGSFTGQEYRACKLPFLGGKYLYNTLFTIENVHKAIVNISPTNGNGNKKTTTRIMQVLVREKEEILEFI